MNIESALALQAKLGEGPVWCEAEQALYWVDIPGLTLNRFDPSTGANRVWPMPEPAGCVALSTPGRLVLALASGLAWFDVATGSIQRFLPIEADNPVTRLNDGRCDRQGRLWVGSMANDGSRRPVGTLYRCDTKTAAPMLGQIAIPNSTCFSLDGRTMYFADTSTRRIRMFDLDTASGAIANERTFTEITDHAGAPDGACVDAEGCVWTALFDGGAVARFRPDGKLDRMVELPTQRPTCPCFGGTGLDTLFITTASNGLDPAAQPMAGHLLTFKPGVRGLPEVRFAGT